MAFQLLFNIITGGGDNMEDMNTQTIMGNNTSFDSLLTGIMILLIKILIIVLVIALLIGIFAWIKNNFFKDINITHYINQNPMLKSIIGITVAIVGLLILISVFNYFINPGMGYGYGTGSMNGYSASGFSGTLGIAGVVTFLVKVLSYVFVITLIISLVAYFKKQFDTGSFHIFSTASPVNKDTTSSDTTKSEQMSKNFSIEQPVPEQENE